MSVRMALDTGCRHADEMAATSHTRHPCLFTLTAAAAAHSLVRKVITRVISAAGAVMVLTWGGSTETSTTLRMPTGWRRMNSKVRRVPYENARTLTALYPRARWIAYTSSAVARSL